MAYPPGALPISRTDATPQAGDHAPLHNATSQAVNDISGHVQAIDSGAFTVGKATLASKIQSVDTPNHIEFHWNGTDFHFRIDGGAWLIIPFTPALAAALDDLPA
jgi:hypothetical protein